MIPYGRQEITRADVDAVTEVLRSDFLTQGPAVPKFERSIADYCGVRHVVAVNSATSALHLACLALGVGSGSRVWTSPISFVASANCARFCGAAVDFVDVEADTGNMSASALSEKLEQAAKEGLLPHVVIPVHLAGLPCDMRAIHELARRYSFRVIEDASHAVGAKYLDTLVGSCRFSDITVFSFHPVKVITAGEGGAASTNDPALAQTMSLLRSHGITRDAAEMSGAPEGAWYYEQLALGFNYRLTDLHAALGNSQLQRLNCYVARRHSIATRYDCAFSRLPVALPARRSERHSAFHLYAIRLNDASLRQRVFDRLRSDGVGVNVHYIPIHRQPYYRGLGFRQGQFPVAEDLYSRSISLPMFPALTDEQQDHVIALVSGALEEA